MRPREKAQLLLDGVMQDADDFLDEADNCDCSACDIILNFRVAVNLMKQLTKKDWH